MPLTAGVWNRNMYIRNIVFGNKADYRIEGEPPSLFHFSVPMFSRRVASFARNRYFSAGVEPKPAGGVSLYVIICFGNCHLTKFPPSTAGN